MNITAEKNSITVTVIENPFDKTKGRRIDIIPFTGQDISLQEALGPYNPEYAIIYDGARIGPDKYPTTRLKPGAVIGKMRRIGTDSDGRLSGAGSKALSMLVMIAAIASGNVLAAGGVWTTASYVAYASVAFVGGYIISRFEPVPGENESSSKGNYGWESPTPNYSQGAPIGITWGEVRVKSPQVLSSAPSNDGKSIFLNLILSGGEGEIDEIKDITVKEAPIEGYSDVTWETRLGTNDQEPLTIETISEAKSEKVLAYTITDSFATDITDSNIAKSIEVVVFFPGGIYSIRNNNVRDGHPPPGTKFQAYFDLRIEYKKTSDSTWSVKTDRLLGADETPIIKRIRIEGLDPAQYDVRVKLTNLNVFYSYHTGTGQFIGYLAATSPVITANCIVNTTGTWGALASYFTVYPVRPCRVLVGMKLKATDQLSGSMPTISWTQVREHVWVYNPETTAYEQQAADNPWWAAYDLIHYARRVKNIHTDEYEIIVRGAPAEALDYDAFKTCADYADTKNIKFNYFLAEPMQLSEALQVMASVGRGAIIIKGATYSATCDMPKTPSQLFTVANMIKSTFKETFVGETGKANAVEITYNDKDKGYERTKLPVYTEDWDDTGITQNPTQIQLDGITDQEQAYQQGKYYLRRNNLIRRHIEFQADIDSIVAEIGDVIRVQHDLPRWGIAGGRVLKVITPTQIQLDCQVTFEEGTNYRLQVRHSETDAISVYEIDSLEGEGNTSDTINLAETPDPALIAYDDIFAIGEENIESKPFVISAIDRAGSMQRKITAEEYNAAIFDDADPGPTIDYSALRRITEVTNLAGAMAITTTPDNILLVNVTASWDLPPSEGEIITRFHIFVSSDGENYWKAGSTENMNFTISSLQAMSYWVKVKTENRFGQISEGVETDMIQFDLTNRPPEDILTLTAGYRDDEGQPGYLWIVAYFNAAAWPANASCIEYRRCAGATVDWDAGEIIFMDFNPILGYHFPSQFKYYAAPVGEHTYMAKVKTTSGVYNVNPASATATAAVWNLTTISATDINVAGTEDMHDNAWTGFSGIVSNFTVDGSGYFAQDSDGGTGYEEAYAIWSLSPSDTGCQEGTLYLQADIVGPGVVEVQTPAETGYVQYNGPVPFSFNSPFTGTLNIKVSAPAGDVQAIFQNLKMVFKGYSKTNTILNAEITDSTRLTPTISFTSIKTVNISVHPTATYPAQWANWSDADPDDGALFYGFKVDVDGTVLTGQDISADITYIGF